MATWFKKNCTLKVSDSRLMACLSFCTIFILIVACVVLITVISVTPIIVLGLGELQAGQRDLILYPTETYLNASKIAALTKHAALPRLKQVLIATNKDFRVEGWFMDFQLQRQHHLGTIGGGQPLNHSFIYASTDFGLTVDEKVSFSFQPLQLWYVLEQHIYESDFPHKSEMIEELKEVAEDHTAAAEFTVKEVFDSSRGKFGIGKASNYIYFDIRYAIQQMIRKTLTLKHPNQSNFALLGYIESPSFTFGDFSEEVTLNINNRVQIYSQADSDQVYRDLISFASHIHQQIGIFSVKSSMPIAQTIVPLSFLGMFIGVILKLIIISLFMLSSIMMSNMLQISADTKYFDFAVIKLLGAGRIPIALTLLKDCFKYILLSNVLAYPLAYLILSMTSEVFVEFFGYRHEISPTFSALVGGFFIGVLVPILASLAPIQNLLGNDLAQNLNPLRNKTEALHTEIYIEGKQFPWGKVMFGFLSTSYGLMIYYLLPKGLINQNIGLLLAVFFLILQGLILGLIVMGFSGQYLLEKLVAYLTLFWADRTDFTLTMKNLSAHRKRNRRTSLLYALSVSFIVFVSVGIDIQIQTIYSELLNTHGCFIDITGHSLNTAQYNAILSSTQGVESWSFLTRPLEAYLKDIGLKEMLASDQAKLFFSKARVLGISENYVSTYYDKVYSPQWTLAEDPYEPYSFLHSPEGYLTCTMSTYMANKFNIHKSGNREILLNYYWPEHVARVKINVSTVYSQRAGLFYSSIMFPLSDVGVSFDTYHYLAGIPLGSPLPIYSIKVKVSNTQNIKSIASYLRNAVKTASEGKVWDYVELSQIINRIDHLLTNILNVLLGLVLLISFFSLLTTSYINILNQTNEIGVLLTLGYSKTRITKIYIYEAFVLVLNSCILGTIVGYIVAMMMGLQRELFSSTAITINISGLPFIFVAAIISSLLSSYQPLTRIFKLPINQILKYS